MDDPGSNGSFPDFYAFSKNVFDASWFRADTQILAAHGDDWVGLSAIGVYKQDNIIVESLDPETETTILPGFRNLRVTIEGNVATIKIEVFPCTGIVFQLNDIFLQLPRIAA